ncbi:MAG: PKD repeat protein [Sphingobacteriales bacterium]|jgi:PKD repeat protein
MKKLFSILSVAILFFFIGNPISAQVPENVNGGINGSVLHQEVYNDLLFFAGRFDSIGTKASYSIGAFNGTEYISLDEIFNHLGVKGKVSSLSVWNDTLFIVKREGKLSGNWKIITYDGLDWNIHSQYPSNSFGISKIHSYRNELIAITPRFPTDSNFSVSKYIHGIWEPFITTDTFIKDIYSIGNKLYLVGDFIQLNNISAGRGAIYNQGKISLIDSTVQSKSFFYPYKLNYFQGKLFVCGIFYPEDGNPKAFHPSAEVKQPNNNLHFNPEVNAAPPINTIGSFGGFFFSNENNFYSISIPSRDNYYINNYYVIKSYADSVWASDPRYDINYLGSAEIFNGYIYLGSTDWKGRLTINSLNYEGFARILSPIDIAEVKRPLALIDEVFTKDIDSLEIDISLNDYDPENRNLNFELITSKPDVEANLTPEGLFTTVNKFTDNDTFLYQVCGGAYCDTGMIINNHEIEGKAPIAANDSFFVKDFKPRIFNLIENDSNQYPEQIKIVEIINPNPKEIEVDFSDKEITININTSHGPNYYPYDNKFKLFTKKYEIPYIIENRSNLRDTAMFLITSYPVGVPEIQFLDIRYRKKDFLRLSDIKFNDPFFYYGYDYKNENGNYKEFKFNKIVPLIIKGINYPANQVELINDSLIVVTKTSENNYDKFVVEYCDTLKNCIQDFVYINGIEGGGTPSEPPVARFKFLIDDDLNATFYNSSTQLPYEYTWLFSDNDTSHFINPKKTFPSKDTYTISLIAKNIVGSDTVTRTVNFKDSLAYYQFKLINDSLYSESVGISTYFNPIKNDYSGDFAFNGFRHAPLTQPFHFKLYPNLFDLYYGTFQTTDIEKDAFLYNVCITDPVFQILPAHYYNYILDTCRAAEVTIFNTDYSRVYSSTSTNTNDDLKISPNPIINSFTLQNISIFPATISIFDITGKSILETIQYDNRPIDFPAVPDGVYMIKVVTMDNHQFTGRILKN